jgi:hypothetical protein
MPAPAPDVWCAQETQPGRDGQVFSMILLWFSFGAIYDPMFTL